MFLGPLRTLLFGAALWLPLAFFIWFYLSALLVAPVRWIAEKVLVGWMPEAFSGSEQAGYVINFVTRLPVDPALLPPGFDPSQGVPAVAIDVNPMIYGYCFPVLIGLVMATPLSFRQRLVQFVISLAVLWPIQAFGVVFDTLKSLRFEAGPAGVAAAEAAGLSANLIAYCYQMGYLILPAVLPIVLWVAMNRAFIERLVTVDDDRLAEVVSGEDQEQAAKPNRADATEQAEVKAMAEDQAREHSAEEHKS